MRVGASERGSERVFNGASGMSDIEGKAAREAASKRGRERVSSDRVHDAKSGEVVASLLAKDFGAGDDCGLLKR